jgi:O-antigen/teichoic acid export membrane protein
MTPADFDTEPARRTSPRRLPSSAWFSNHALGGNYLRANALILGANVIAGVFAYLLHPILGHLMGVGEYGQVAALIALSLVIQTPTQLVAIVAAKYAASIATGRKVAKLNDFTRRSTMLLLPAGIVIAGLFAIVSSHVAAFFHLSSREGVVLLGLFFVVSFVTPLNLGLLQGLERFGWYAAIIVLSTFLRLVLPSVLVVAGFGVAGVMLGIAAGAVLAYLCSFFPLRNIVRGPREAMGSLRSLWAFALLAAGAAAGVVALLTIDTVLARHYLDPHDAGLYAALAIIGRSVLFITSSVTIVMFPRVVALHEQKQRHAHVLIQALVGTLLLAGTFEVALSVDSSSITAVMFGEKFAAIAGLLPLYGIAMLLLAMAQVLVTYLLAMGDRRVVLAIALSCVLEAVLIIWRHETIRQFVEAVVIADALLVTLLVGMSLPAVIGRTGGRRSRPNVFEPG